MEKGQSPSKANEGTPRFVFDRSRAVLLATTLLSMLVFHHLKKKKKSVKKNSTEGASTPSSIPLIPTGGGSSKYNVFLSFTGSDTRKGFTDHLYHSLINAGAIPISISSDDNSLKTGEDFNSENLDVIVQSKISIPIISENYASSERCLRELVRIMYCKKRMSHVVLPIFYKVNPSDVRNVTGNFGKAFHLHKKGFDKKDIQEAKQAFAEVSFLIGWESEKFANGNEGELVEKVVKTILSKVRHKIHPGLPMFLVGVDSHLNKIQNWVDTPTSHARMLGLYGLGGISKTTLAKIIYNVLLDDFEQRNFLSDIRETAHHNGIPYLQNQLIKGIFPNERDVWTVDDGVHLIKSRFKAKKVLIILDDIDHKDQLDALARNRNWFMAGSIIIVTTRYEYVLDQSEFDVDYKYALRELDSSQSLLLFQKHAFDMGHSLSGFEGISHDIISTMGGLPLALEVIGSFLHGKKKLTIWHDVLNRLRKEPSIDVQKILKISYDALEPGHKEMFLDIACFFIGKESKFAIYVWEDLGFYASQGIQELKMRCLIKYGDDDKLMMHNQLRDLGRSIVRHEGPPEKCSRLWVYNEAYRVLTEEKGTQSIQAISLDKYNDHLQTYTNEQFKDLQHLRFLQLRWAALSGDFKELFSELRWLQWLDIEPNLSFLATNLHLPKLLVLRLSHTQITEHWRGWSSIMAAKRLKVLDLAFCNCLTCTPDLSPIINLEILILAKCSKLEQLHPSIGKVKSLLFLDLRNCYRLKELQEEVGELRELEELILDNTGIAKIPMSIGLLENLKNLSANDCSSLREIPNSIGSLSSLQHLNLQGCKSLIEIPVSIGNLSSLQHLNLQGCESLREIPNSIGNLHSLEHLDLQRCQLREIPSSIGDIQNLQHLDISESLIEKLPSVIGKLKNLRTLCLKLCDSLEGEIPSELGDLSSLEILEITRAHISDLPESIHNLSSLQHSLRGCAKLQSMPEFPFGLKNLTITCQSPKLPQLSHLVHLEELDLFGCRQLEYIPKLHSRLSKLRVASCPKLILPKLDGFLKLERLSIENCSSIERLDLSELNRLRRLHVGLCYRLVEIHACDNLKFLEEIVVDRCKSIERLILPKAQRLKAKSCDNLVQLQGLDRANFLALDIIDCGSIETLPDLSCIMTLRELNITRCESLEKLPNLSKFEKLENFTMRYSPSVTEIPGIEGLKSITQIDITGCKSVATLADLLGCDKLQSLVVRDCKKLPQLQGLEKLNLSYLDISGCAMLETIPKLPKTRIIRNYEKE